MTQPTRRARRATSDSTGKGASRAAASQSKRDEIIAAAVAVLAREGLAQTTTRKIAAEANVNQAMIGYYFGGKDDLLFAALQEMIGLTATIVRAAMAERAEPERALVCAMRAFWTHVESHFELQIMQFELTLYALRRPESAWLAREQYAGYITLVADLTRAAFEGSGRACALPYDELARFIVGGLDGLILQYVSDQDQQRARRDLEHLIRAAVQLATGAASGGAGYEGAADAE
jgi:AcrR family transcriptional regulator